MGEMRTLGGMTSLCLGLILFGQASHLRAGSKAELMAAIDSLRGIQPVAAGEDVEALNKKMDAAWTVLLGKKKSSIPLVEAELAKALRQDKPDQYFILDMSQLLLAMQGPQALTLAAQALSRIDGGAPVIKVNTDGLFHLALSLAQSGAAVLPQIDRLFLEEKAELKVFVVQHVLTLDSTLLCVFLYGSSGPDVEDHLLGKFGSNLAPYQAKRLLEILGWLGSEKSVPAAAPYLQGGDHELFARALKVMMALGGASGREAVLNLKAGGLSKESRAYLKKVLPNVKKAGYESQLRMLEEMAKPDPGLSDAKLEARLEKMIKNYGKDDELPAANILLSGLPQGLILGKLKRIRQMTLFRLSDEALDDVLVDNRIINALQYKASQ